jgi:hypothetical protein
MSSSNIRKVLYNYTSLGLSFNHYEISKYLKDVDPKIIPIITTLYKNGLACEGKDKYNEIISSIPPPYNSKSKIAYPLSEDLLPLVKFQKAIIEFYKAGYHKTINSSASDKEILDYINKHLLQNQAIITGGFILKQIYDFEDNISDLDIFVRKENYDAVTIIFRPLFLPKLSTEYVFNPINKDGIPYNYTRCISATKYDRDGAFMDICKVHGPRPEDIIKNFDLTICENYYDGNKIFSLYPEHIKMKKGFYEDNFVHELFKYNYSIGKGRIQKYISRGYSIFLRKPEGDEENKEIIKITPQYLDTFKPETKLIFDITVKEVKHY